MSKTYMCSFFCYFEEAGSVTKHYQQLPLKDISKWIDAYRFKHPNVQSISVRVWFERESA